MDLFYKKVEALRAIYCGLCGERNSLGFFENYTAVCDITPNGPCEQIGRRASTEPMNHNMRLIDRLQPVHPSVYAIVAHSIEHGYFDF